MTKTKDGNAVIEPRSGRGREKNGKSGVYCMAIVTTSVAAVYASREYAPLMPLFELVPSAPTSSAPVERVFSQSGLIVMPNHAKMSNKMLEELVFLKCNDL